MRDGPVVDRADHREGVHDSGTSAAATRRPSRPGRLEAIGLNSPRSSAGAFGFMSKVSCWGTPPNWCRKITDLARTFRPDCASARKAAGRLSPRFPGRRPGASAGARATNDQSRRKPCGRRIVVVSRLRSGVNRSSLSLFNPL